MRLPKDKSDFLFRSTRKKKKKMPHTFKKVKKECAGRISTEPTSVHR